ncbi:class I SAM-dependent methyltransferase [Actinoallomurus soli]|uniref:class I SAM-dependent methyltransferase n=1 Tax=Actinoallomurus soli TaxID=2952535 RepID=UPI002092A2E5|nr:class I SAM-dependent methyltransferase [Actinoallomurus soli]MCO5969922.1 class I SAM-dependent methyltransferase [Actinoallomurus soli]
MNVEEQRAYARRLAAESIAQGDATGWFERLYAAAERGETAVPWADLEPNPLLRAWARPEPGRAVVVGCGLGDDAEYLAGLGHDVTAFDVSGTAVARARSRFPGSRVRYRTADLLAPPPQWRRAFDLVVESYTVQVLRGDARERAIAHTADLVAPGGTLLVIARAREESDDPGRMPWPLTRAEIESFPLPAVRIEDLLDDEDPPVRRWRAEFRRPAVS